MEDDFPGPLSLELDDQPIAEKSSHSGSHTGYTTQALEHIAQALVEAEVAADAVVDNAPYRQMSPFVEVVAAPLRYVMSSTCLVDPDSWLDTTLARKNRRCQMATYYCRESVLTSLGAQREKEWLVKGFLARLTKKRS